MRLPTSINSELVTELEERQRYGHSRPIVWHVVYILSVWQWVDFKVIGKFLDPVLYKIRPMAYSRQQAVHW